MPLHIMPVIIAPRDVGVIAAIGVFLIPKSALRHGGGAIRPNKDDFAELQVSKRHRK